MLVFEFELTGSVKNYQASYVPGEGRQGGNKWLEFEEAGKFSLFSLDFDWKGQKAEDGYSPVQKGDETWLVYMFKKWQKYYRQR